jgi:hypothetical protein
VTAEFLNRLRCHALNQTLTEFCVTSARPISNEYGPLQMGALAHRFTRPSFFRFRQPGGCAKKSPDGDEVGAELVLRWHPLGDKPAM